MLVTGSSGFAHHDVPHCILGMIETEFTGNRDDVLCDGLFFLGASRDPADVGEIFPDELGFQMGYCIGHGNNILCDKF